MQDSFRAVGVELKYGSEIRTAAAAGGAIQIAGTIPHQAAARNRPIAAASGKTIKHRLSVIGIQFKHCSEAESSAVSCDAIDVSRRVADQGSIGEFTISATGGERMEYGFRAIRGKFINCPRLRVVPGRSVKIAGGIQDQRTTERIIPVVKIRAEAVQHSLRTRRIKLERRSDVASTTLES